MNNSKLNIMIGVVLLGVLLYLLSPVLTPFILAIILAYLTDPLVNFLSRLKIPRTLAVAIVFFGIILVTLLLLILLIPLLQAQLQYFFASLPDMMNWLQQNALPVLNEWTDIDIDIDLQQVKTVINQHWQQVGNAAKMLGQILAQSGIALISWSAKLLIVAVVTFYLLRDWDQVLESIHELLPRSIEPLIVRLVRDCDQVLSAFFRGQLLVMLALAAFYTVGLWLAGIKVALLIGVFIGFISIIPYLGGIVGIIAATIATLVQYHDWLHLIYIFIIFAIGHVLENMVLTPSLLGNRIGLHPVAVIFAVLAGGQLFGFMGVLLALPVASILVVLLRYLKGRYISSDWYGQASS